jgi:hypothetical protein
MDKAKAQIFGEGCDSQEYIKKKLGTSAQKTVKKTLEKVNAVLESMKAQQESGQPADDGTLELERDVLPDEAVKSLEGLENELAKEAQSLLESLEGEDGLSSDSFNTQMTCLVFLLLCLPFVIAMVCR